MTAFVSSIDLRPAKRPRPSRASRAAPLTVALVNNMPDAALVATERQFRRLIVQTNGPEVRLKIYSIAEMPRGEAGRAYCRAHYAPVDALLGESVDALVVTGCEPRAGSLADEPFWPSFVRLVEWAKRNTVSALWSCLAAHAAVLHLDGITRQRLPGKLFGVFACETVANHPLFADAGAVIDVPHSRYNDVREDDLTRNGYQVLTRSAQAGVDCFIKPLRSLFVFLQGHPEYEGDSLGWEFRRDIGRFLDGERDTFPPLPRRFYDDETLADLRLFWEEAARGRTPSALARFPATRFISPRHAEWQAAAACLYRNWLGQIVDERSNRVHAPSLSRSSAAG